MTHLTWEFEIKWVTLLCAVDPDGNVCISILHEPGDDKYGYEKASERWLPIHTVETILVSVISMLADPNDESPANVDAAVSMPYVLLPNIKKIPRKKETCLQRTVTTHFIKFNCVIIVIEL